MTDHKTYLAPPSTKTPWKAEDVELLNRFQKEPGFHPYTCPNWHGEPADRRNLVATTNGWICQHCDYKQNWANIELVRKWV